MNDHEELPVLNLIQQIKNGTISAKTLTKELRQQCVEALIFEGYTETNIAQLLAKSHKTIKRDIRDIRERNALSPNPELAKQLIGDLVQKAEIRQSYLARLARTKDASVGERANAEYFSFQVTKELIKLLQSLGYLPSTPQEVDIYHHQNEVTCDDMKKQVIEIEAIAQESGNLSSEDARRLELIKVDINKVEISEKLNSLTSTKDMEVQNEKSDPEKD